MLPPRRRWPRPGRERRNDPASDPPKEAAAALCRYVTGCLADTSLSYPWLIRLRAFTSSVQARALGWDASTLLLPPTINLKPAVKGDFSTKCRAISEYSLDDAILCSCFAAYLRDAIDKGLDPNCLAFRPSQPVSAVLLAYKGVLRKARKYQSWASNLLRPTNTPPARPDRSVMRTRNMPPDFNDAIRKLRAFRSSFSARRTLWVAECDIQGFYDAVSHDVVRAEVSAFKERFRLNIDPRLLHFLESTLRSYSYNEYARPTAVRQLRARGIDKPVLSDPASALRDMGIEPSAYYGIPQGSAFSCVLANLVLSRADKEVRAVLDAGWLTRSGIYLRYCDDIVIVDSAEWRCGRAIKKYELMLKELKLPYHRSAVFTRYGRRFWKGKSKAPYRWSDSGKSSSRSHWLSFVGYQIHRDGRTRIRKSSIRSEIKKQREVVNETIRMLSNRIRILGTPSIHRSVTYRTMMHLIAIAVGHPNSGKIAPAANGVGWTKGFKALCEDRIEPTALRALDRSRTLELRRQKQHLKWLVTRGRVNPTPPPRAGGKVEVKFAGRPFSYFQQFERFIEKDAASPLWTRILGKIDSALIKLEEHRGIQNS